MGYSPMADGIEKILQSLEIALWDRTVSRLWAIGHATDVRLSAQKSTWPHKGAITWKKNVWVTPFTLVSELGEKVNKKDGTRLAFHSLLSWVETYKGRSVNEICDKYPFQGFLGRAAQ